MLIRKIKHGKEEIVYLLTKVIEKYKQETGNTIIQNTNRKNYESIAVLLSDISNQLPNKIQEWQTDDYPASLIKDKSVEYPYRKYDITSGQIKDAVSGIVSNPRHFLVDACYIYLYGIGRKGFEQNPIDTYLIENTNDVQLSNTPTTNNNFTQSFNTINSNKRKDTSIILKIIIALLVGILGIVSWYFYTTKQELSVLKIDMSLIPYKPSSAEIDSLEGIWLCYTGSPQARISNADRFHKVVPNIIEVKYKNGYFTFERFGASFNHIGYMQIESKGIVSIYSRIKNNLGIIESPRHSLMNLQNKKNGYIAAMSTSWNFDVGNNNRIVGIREIYTKLGKGGKLQEVINEVENASCQCKIVKWINDDKTIQTFKLKNELLENIQPKEIQNLINENSILLNEPDTSIILHKIK